MNENRGKVLVLPASAGVKDISLILCHLIMNAE